MRHRSIHKSLARTSADVRYGISYHFWILPLLDDTHKLTINMKLSYQDGWIVSEERRSSFCYSTEWTSHNVLKAPQYQMYSSRRKRRREKESYSILSISSRKGPYLQSLTFPILRICGQNWPWNAVCDLPAALLCRRGIRIACTEQQS